MTTAEMLAEVTAQIRKDVPRLMELREGCVLLNKNNKDKFEIIGIDADFDEYVCLKNKKYVTSVTFKNINLFEIIGHDIMLNDVLCWLQLLGLSMEIQSYNGENTIGLYYISIDEKGDAHEEYVTWNLLSPYLKDQLEEMINFLYGLKQKIDG